MKKIGKRLIENGYIETLSGYIFYITFEVSVDHAISTLRMFDRSSENGRTCVGNKALKTEFPESGEVAGNIATTVDISTLIRKGNGPV